ncbi:TonB-dependent siderophore receptor, partial [Marivirga lumbricoides]
RGYRLADGSVTRTYDPAQGSKFLYTEIDGVKLPQPNVDYFNLTNPSNTIKNVQNYTMNSVFEIPSNLSVTHGAYIQEQLNFGKLTALLSARYEWFNDFTNYGKTNQQSFSNQSFIPRVGLSYELNRNINIYVTYLEGFQPQSNTVELMPNTESYIWNPNSAAQFDPLLSDLKEIGAKGVFFGGDITTSVAIYEINQNNILVPSKEDPDFLVQRGSDRSRGFEWDVSGYALPNLQINASYSFIEAIIMDDDNEALIGERKENTPRHNVNLWARYDFPFTSVLKGFGIGFGMQHRGERIPWQTRDFMIPAFTVFDAAIYYKPINSNMQLMVKMNNILNKTYWLGAINYTRLFPGTPRNSLLTITYKF